MLLASAGLPLTAHAHANAGWAHGLLDGAAVFVGTVEYLLPVLAAALLSSRETASIRCSVCYIAAGLLLGMFCAYAASDIIVVALIAQIYLSLLGLLVLLELRLPVVIVTLLRFLAGGMVGLELGNSTAGAPLSEPALTLGFIVTAAGMYTATGLIASHVRTGWQRIAIRIVGSWIVAIAVIYIAYLIRQFR